MNRADPHRKWSIIARDCDCPNKTAAFTISRHTSSRGGLLFHALLSLLFELPSVANRDECSSSEPGGLKPSIEITGSYDGRGAAVGRGLGVGVSLGVGLGEGTANAYTLLSPAT